VRYAHAAIRSCNCSTSSCRRCQGIYTLYTRTIFEGAQVVPAQVVLLLRGVFHGQSSAQLARELDLSEKTVLKRRRCLHYRAQAPACRAGRAGARADSL
jgi:hypothetical protein